MLRRMRGLHCVWLPGKRGYVTVESDPRPDFDELHGTNHGFRIGADIVSVEIRDRLNGRFLARRVGELEVFVSGGDGR